MRVDKVRWNKIIEVIRVKEKSERSKEDVEVMKFLK